MKRLLIGLCVAIWAAGLCSGCSGERSVAGGTKGTLQLAGASLRDVRIDVYSSGAAEPIGFGVTGDGGRFELYRPDASEALHLEPGDYAFTLEPVGPEPIALRPELRQLQRTPLRKRWDATEPSLELIIP